jgi:hypothetical protein
MCRIFPTWCEIDAFPTPLYPGERALAAFLDKNLPPAYRIYVQPVLNGMHPDVVVVNPRWGVIVYEVKDWNLGPLHWRDADLVRETAAGPVLERDPMSQARHYAGELFRQFLSVEEATRGIGDQSNDFRISLAAIYLHGSSPRDIEELFGEYSFGAGDQANLVLHEQNLSVERAVPWTQYGLQRSRFITPRQEEALEELHRWLQPIANQAFDFVPKVLSKHQSRLAEPQQGDFRVRGVAGSGKSLVLATRAARASRQGAVVVTCFNITMAHVLRDLMAKCGERVNWGNVRVRHFHGLLKDIAQEAGLITKNASFDAVKTIEAIKTGLTLQSLPARGIYIDEGQDFYPEWVDSLARLKSTTGELVFMADYRQGLYDRPGAADGRSLRVARFHQGWHELNKTFRLPWRIPFLLNELAARVKLGDEYDPELADYEPKQKGLVERLTWTNFACYAEAISGLNRLLYESTDNPSDIVVLVRTHELGLRVVLEVETVDQRYQPVTHIFGESPDSEESNRRKHAFWMGRGGLKACTIHSFKGWELNNVIVLWDGEWCKRDLSELYVALSRAYLCLDVLNVSREYDWIGDLDIWDEVHVSQPC